MRRFLFLTTFSIAACHAAASTSASDGATVKAWAPHSIEHPTALAICDELREGGVVSRCMTGDGGTSLALALLVGQPNANHVSVFQFSSPETLEAFMKEEGDAVSHTSLRFNMAIVPKGNVPDATRQKFADALDAL